MALRDKYAFDVFFSYAWGTDTKDQALRDWSRKVADTIRTLLSQRFNGSDVQFNAYLDRDLAKSGQDLSTELESATKRSAIFVAMVSDYYGSPYCQQEMNWFCDQLLADGGSITDHVCLLRVQQPSDPAKWPARFRGANGDPLLYIDFCNASGQPINMAQYMLSGSLAGLADPVEKAALEIADKIIAVRSKVAAREEYQTSQHHPDKPLIFFEAEPSDKDRWSEFSRLLKAVPSIVLPAGMPIAATVVVDGKEFIGCDGLVMLRSRVDDDIGSRIKSAYLQRRVIYRNKKAEVPWALLDEIDPAPPESEAFEMPRIKVESGWVQDVQKALLGA